MTGPSASVLRDARRTGRIVHSEQMGSIYLLRVRVPDWPPAAAGQFAMLQAVGSRCFLPRPFSVHDERDSDTRSSPAGDSPAAELSFLIAPVGAGTDELCSLEPGDDLLVLGPLGHGFDVRELASGRRLLVVAGGVGVAPFALLLRRLVETGSVPEEVLVLLGFRDEYQAESLHLLAPLVDSCRERGLPARLEVITEDGHLGRAGLVTELLAEELKPGDHVAVCGAQAMCEAVWDLCLERGGPTANVRAWFSLEAGMACGFGSCQGCVIPLADGSLSKVCRQGPVYPGEQVFGEQRHPCVWGEEGIGLPASDGGEEA